MSDANAITLVRPAALRVRDPLSGGSLWTAGYLAEPRMEGAVLVVEGRFPEAIEPAVRVQVLAALEENLRGLGYEGVLDLRDASDQAGAETSAEAPQKEETEDKSQRIPGAAGPGVGPHGGPILKSKIPGVKRIIAVASGKGGVGKSTISVNLAVGLHRAGFSVGLLDADVYGPSVPRMMNVVDTPRVGSDERILPPSAFGVRCLSSGMLVADDQAIIWRGPMVMDLIRTFLQKTDWGELDYLVVDLPPGTGDAQLTLIQAVDIDGAIIVTTPQPVALADAIRGINMFEKLEVPLLGLVENMAYYLLPDGTRDYVFGREGGRQLAKKHNTGVLAEIPLRTTLRESGDNGLPAVLGQGDSAAVFTELAKLVAGRVPV